MTISNQYLRVDSGAPLARLYRHYVALDAGDTELIDGLIRQHGDVCRTHASWSSLIESDTIQEPGCAIGYLDGEPERLEALPRLLNELRSPISIIWLSRRPRLRDVVAAMRGGAVCVLTLPEDANRLAHAVEDSQAKSRESYFRMQESSAAQDRLAMLTEGERDVLLLALSGAMNKTISRRLDIAVRTVENRRNKIVKKLGTRSSLLIARMLHAAGQMPDESMLTTFVEQPHSQLEAPSP